MNALFVRIWFWWRDGVVIFCAGRRQKFPSEADNLESEMLAREDLTTMVSTSEPRRAQAGMPLLLHLNLQIPLHVAAYGMKDDEDCVFVIRWELTQPCVATVITSSTGETHVRCVIAHRLLALH